MDINDLHPPDDYSHRFFIWHEWIQANGSLNAENVFDYFATSMFYDKQSNNQVLRMQTMHTGVPVKDEAAELRRFTGIEFAVVHAQPPTFFVIQKRERLSPDEVKPLAAYFIMNNRIYQSPDLYTVISNRLLTSLSALQSSLDILRKHRPDYTPRTGFVWPIAGPSLTTDSEGPKKTRDSDTPDQDTTMEGASPTTSDAGSPEKRGLDGSQTGPKRQQNTMLLMNAMKATAAHSKMSFTPASASLNNQSETEGQNSETPKTGVASSTATPVPHNSGGSSQPGTQEIVGGGGGGVKKKKKRGSLAPPPVPP
ncbi:MED6-domain-containing protein [Crepidotus variabilis]|uniref:Mediator of RNA polymerase II transcription subunit 6 n=1 Tax=Crepidotus variabilis TaxID=179855 RepID=A0A9P6EUB6_9AGAR|nr:MED6-domain-containing protein [Crepidotus variabilis]